jgi:hypothetical protein
MADELPADKPILTSEAGASDGLTRNEEGPVHNDDLGWTRVLNEIEGQELHDRQQQQEGNGTGGKTVSVQIKF